MKSDGSIFFLLQRQYTVNHHVFESADSVGADRCGEGNVAGKHLAGKMEKTTADHSYAEDYYIAINKILAVSIICPPPGDLRSV